MDPSVALMIGALIGAVAGVGGAWLTNRANATQQRDEREHGRQVERERWEREDRHRFAAERRVLYGRMVALTDRIFREVPEIIELPADHDVSAFHRDLDELVNEILLICSAKVEEAVTQLWIRTGSLLNAALEIDQPAELRDPTSSWSGTRNDAEASQMRFVGAARKELGVEP